MSDALVKENEELKATLANNSQGIHGLLAQLDAHKQAYNDSLTQALQLRTNIILLQKSNKELADKVEELTKKLAAVESPVTAD